MHIIHVLISAKLLALISIHWFSNFASSKHATYFLRLWLGPIPIDIFPAYYCWWNLSLFLRSQLFKDCTPSQNGIRGYIPLMFSIYFVEILNIRLSSTVTLIKRVFIVSCQKYSVLSWMLFLFNTCAHSVFTLGHHRRLRVLLSFHASECPPIRPSVRLPVPNETLRISAIGLEFGDDAQYHEADRYL